MHRTFKKLLPRATGQSDWVAAINVDIRGFTSRMSGDPAVTALYLRTVYRSILSDYFRGSSFFKPTGDGLLLIIPFPEGKRRSAIAERVLRDSLSLVKDFPTLASHEQLLPSALPEQIGIGISAGSTSRMSSGGITLDYTGPALNIATRLMDLARPAGVVCDAAVIPTSLPRPLARSFDKDSVYLRGVAESTPLEIRYTAALTSIPESYRHPIAGNVPVEQTEVLTFRAIRERGRTFRLPLDSEPLDRKAIEVEVKYPVYKNNKRVGTLRKIMPYTRHVQYMLEGTKPRLTFNYEPLITRLTQSDVRQADKIEVFIRYAVRPS